LRDAKLQIHALVERRGLGLVDRRLELLDLRGVGGVGHHGSLEVPMKPTERLRGILSGALGEDGANLFFLGIGQIEPVQHGQRSPAIGTQPSEPTALALG
jgi:hypothetical protein